MKRENIRAYLERNPGLSFVARDDLGHIAGAVLAGHDGRRGFLHHLAVDEYPPAQGTGTTPGRTLPDSVATDRNPEMPRFYIRRQQRRDGVLEGRWLGRTIGPEGYFKATRPALGGVSRQP